MTSATTDRIARAALELIAERGLAGVTMRAIAEAAGVARQTLYNHYPDVDSIVAAVVAAHSNAAVERLEALMATCGGPVERLEQLVRHLVVIGAEAHHTPEIRHGLSPAAQESLDVFEVAVRTTVENALREGRENGQFSVTLDPHRDALVLMRTFGAIRDLARSGVDPADTADTVLRLVRAFVAD